MFFTKFRHLYLHSLLAESFSGQQYLLLLPGQRLTALKSKKIKGRGPQAPKGDVKHPMSGGAAAFVPVEMVLSIIKTDLCVQKGRSLEV